MPRSMLTSSSSTPRPQPFRIGQRFGYYILDYVLNPEFLCRRWPWYTYFLLYMDRQREMMGRGGTGGLLTATGGWSPKRNFKTWYEMPTSVQDMVKRVMDDPHFFKDKAKVNYFLNRYPWFDLRIRKSGAWNPARANDGPKVPKAGVGSKIHAG